MRKVRPTTRKAAFMFQRSLIQPMIGGLMASPRAWMTKMFSANAVARMWGGVTLARIVLLGPVLKNRQKTARNRKIHDGVPHSLVGWTYSTPRSMGKPVSRPAAETRK